MKLCHICQDKQAKLPGSTCGLECATKWDNQVNSKSGRKIPNDNYETIMARFNAHMVKVKGVAHG